MSEIKWQWGDVYERAIAKAKTPQEKLHAVKLALDASNKRINAVLLNEMNKRQRLLDCLKTMRKEHEKQQ